MRLDLAAIRPRRDRAAQGRHPARAIQFQRRRKDRAVNIHRRRSGPVGLHPARAHPGADRTPCASSCSLYGISAFGRNAPESGRVMLTWGFIGHDPFETSVIWPQNAVSTGGRLPERPLTARRVSATFDRLAPFET